MNKFTLCLVLSLATVGVRAEQTPAVPASAPAASAPASIPAPLPPVGPGANPHLMSSTAQQPVLTPEETQILKQAGIELQKDPELVDLNNQIKALMEKRMKLAEEKLQKLNPEAAAALKKLKAAQEKMAAERKAQMEAMQAKYKAQQEAAEAAKAAPVPAPVTPATPVVPPAGK